jgi:hypothetical protein
MFALLSLTAPECNALTNSKAEQRALCAPGHPRKADAQTYIQFFAVCSATTNRKLDVCSHLCGAARDIESKRVALAARALLKNARERRRIFRAFCVCIKQIAWIMQPRALLSNLIHHGSLPRSRFPCNNVNNSLCRARHGGAFVTRFSPRSPTQFFRQHPDTATHTA